VHAADVAIQRTIACGNIAGEYTGSHAPIVEESFTDFYHWNSVVSGIAAIFRGDLRLQQHLEWKPQQHAEFEPSVERENGRSLWDSCRS
jgi:hypothetical protein